MAKGKSIVSVFLIAAVLIVTITAATQPKSPSFASAQLAAVMPTGPAISMPYAAQTTFTAMTGLNATVIGTVHIVSLSPSCSQSNPPCAVPVSVLYYLVTNGHIYRLIFLNGAPVTNYSGKQVVVYGFVVTPSSFLSSQWAPTLYFDGDIYVRSLVYYLPPQ